MAAINKKKKKKIQYYICDRAKSGQCGNDYCDCADAHIPFRRRGNCFCNTKQEYCEDEETFKRCVKV